MKKLLIIVLMNVGLSSHSELSNIEKSPYINIGFQFGINSYKEFYRGYQISVGILLEGSVDKSNSGIRFVDCGASPSCDSQPTYLEYIRDSYLPSISYGVKKYKNKKEKYIDFQTMFINDGHHWPGWGIGLGRKFYQNHSNIRLKGYVCFPPCITYDYDFKNKIHNYSAFLLFPIVNYQHFYTR